MNKEMNKKIGDFLIDDFLGWVFAPLSWFPTDSVRLERERLISDYLEILEFDGKLSSEERDLYFKYICDNVEYKIRNLIAMKISENL